MRCSFELDSYELGATRLQCRSFAYCLVADVSDSPEYPNVERQVVPGISVGLGRKCESEHIQSNIRDMLASAQSGQQGSTQHYLDLREDVVVPDDLMI